MISPELLRRYPFFGPLNHEQLKSIAMIADEKEFQPEMVIFAEGQPANILYFLMDGKVDLFITIQDDDYQKEFPISGINPGEPFSISSMIEPYTLTASARTSNNTKVIMIDAISLRDLCNQDKDLGFTVIKQLAKAAIERLNATRVQLAACLA
jgi:CRP/FNR family cyclic AMP-dependent transcriptional regulator